MTHAEVNAIGSNTRVSGDYKSHERTPVGLPPESYDDDSSRGGKKTRRYLFDRLSATSPSSGSSYDIQGKSTEQLIALYKSLSPEEKIRLLAQIDKENANALAAIYSALSETDRIPFLSNLAKATPDGTFVNLYKSLPENVRISFIKDVLSASGDKIVEILKNLTPEQKQQLDTLLGSYINSLPSDNRKEFLSKLATALQSLMAKDKKLTAKEKEAVNAFIAKIQKYLNKGGKGHFDGSGIENIMMIMVKAFTQNMNTESMDMLSQIQSTQLTNTFLQVAQKVLQENMKKNEDLLKTSSSGGGWGFWLMIGIIVTVVVLACVVPELLPEAAEVGAEVGAEAVPELAEAGGSALETAPEEIEMTNMADIGGDIGADVGTESMEATSTEASESASVDASTQTASEEATQTEADAAENVGDAESGSGSEAPKESRSYWERMRARQIKNWGEDLKGVNRFIKAGGRLLTKGKYLLYGTGAGFGGYMIMNQLAPDQVPHGDTLPNSPEVQRKLSQYQMVSQYETGVVNINNNQQQTTSKRMSDDSEKISQSSGYVQQAIQMFGQAYSFRA